MQLVTSSSGGEYDLFKGQLFFVKPLPAPMPNYCQLNTELDKLQGNWNQNAKLSFPEKLFENMLEIGKYETASLSYCFDPMISTT